MVVFNMCEFRLLWLPRIHMIVGCYDRPKSENMGYYGNSNILKYKLLQ
jgi:hypothetical protein